MRSRLYSGKHAVIGQFTAAQKKVFPRLHAGQRAFERMFRAHLRAMGEDLGNGQHPCCIVSGGLQGHPAFVVGMDSAGLTLAHQVPGAKIRNADGTLTDSFRRFLDLGKSKHLKVLPHVKSTSGELNKAAYYYYKNGGKVTKELYDALGFKEEIGRVDGKLTLPACLLEDILERGELFETIQKNSAAQYRKQGLLFSDKESEDERFILAMNAEDALRDLEAVRRYQQTPKGAGTPELALVVRDHIAARQYVLDKTGAKFEKISTDERDAQVLAAELPEGEDWELLAHHLIAGTESYRKTFYARTGRRDSVGTFGCADSRQPAEAYGGPSTEESRDSCRNVGAAMTIAEDKFAPEVDMYLAIEWLRGHTVLDVVHTHCGAKTEEAKYCTGQGDSLPSSFQEMGEDAKPLYDKITENGKLTLEEAIARDSAIVGFRVGDLANCLSKAQLDRDRAAIQKKYPGLEVVYGIMDMQAGNAKQLYICDNEGRYRPVSSHGTGMRAARPGMRTRSKRSTYLRRLPK